MKRAAFLDRDGVINRKAPEGHYITRWEQMEFLPGIGDAIRLLNQLGYFVAVVSNQRCVAKGLISVLELEAIHDRMCRSLLTAGAKIDAIYFCPHDYEPGCQCRKPQPGMLLNAARDHQIDLTASWMIGDSASDIEAGKRAGCRTALVLANDAFIAPETKGERGRANIEAPSLLVAVRGIVETEASFVTSNLHESPRP